MLPNSLPAPLFRRLVIEAIVLPIFVLTSMAGLLFWQIQQMRSADRLVDHTDRVIAQDNAILKQMVDAETGQRGYLVGGKSLFLEPYILAQNSIPSALDSLERLVGDNPSQAQRVREIRTGYRQWLANAEQEIAVRDRGGDVRPLFNRADGKRLMDNLRAQHAAFVAVETELRNRRMAAQERVTRATLVSATLLLVLAGCILAVFTRRQIGVLSRHYRQALTTVDESRQNLAITLNSIGDAVLVTDTSGRVTSMNPVAERLTGWTQAEAQDRPSSDIFPIQNETTRDVVVSPIDRVLREGVVVGLANHTILVRRDGTETPIDDSGAPIRDHNGNLIGVVLVFRDISERRLAEASLRDHQEKIENLNVRLQRAMAETHHRVKNNLQVVASMVDMHLMEGPKTPAYNEFERLGMQIRTLAAVHDILTAEARSDGQADALSSTFIRDKLLPMLQTTAGNRQLRFQVEDLRLTARQGTAVALIVNELISNAIKHGQGPVEVSLTAANSLVRLEVCDSGPGFRPAEGEGVFDPRQHAHTGLELVETISTWDLAGSIVYANRSEGGAQVTVTFPLETIPAAVEQEAWLP